ncbi:GNAT family N-acetyltransferase [Kribbella sp. GL6]|uniref:GNAT family N-acetyltransferase n=1 Tax=Kribbella sp. GL6 TaxID=3419765 RepID=UPI003D028DA6
MRTTERLVLRPFRESDLEPWAVLNADPEVTRYLGAALTREESERVAAAVNAAYERNGYGFLAVERRADGVFVGAAGLSREEFYPDDLEIGWRLAREYWGHGYATEAAASWLDYAFREAGLPRVIAVTDTPNVRSIAVMRRLGMRFDHEAVLTADGVPFDATIYSLKAEEWRR